MDGSNAAASPKTHPSMDDNPWKLHPWRSLQDWQRTLTIENPFHHCNCLCNLGQGGWWVFRDQWVFWDLCVLFIFLSPKEPTSKRENFNSEEIAAQHWVPCLPTMPTFLHPHPRMLSIVVGSVREWNKRVRTKVQFLGTRDTLGTSSSLEALPTPSQTCLQSYCLLPGHCGEPPPWEHEDSKRIYHFMVGQKVHYECIQGYKALQRGPAVSICRMMCGKTGWTQPRLTCVDEREHHQFPGTLC